jgi:hypothetical protein
MPARTRRARRLAILLLPVAAAIGAVTLIRALGSSSAANVQQAKRSTPPLQAPLQAPHLPLPPAPAFKIPKPLDLEAAPDETRWAPVRMPTVARTAPDAGATPIETLSTRTPEGTTNLVLVLGRREDSSGRLWIRVRLPILPNNTVGWVPRSTLGGYGVVRTHLVVDVERLTATLFRDGRPILRAPVGVGKPETPTPRGEFYIRDKLASYASPFYGPLAFGTSARSSTLTDWPAGGFIGIHGTSEPELLPGRVSHGCIRLRNEDIVRLGRLMPVGTPLTIR